MSKSARRWQNWPRRSKAVQAVTGEHIELAEVDQGHTGEEPAAAAHEFQLAVVKLPEAKRGVVFLPRRCISSPSPVSCCIASLS
jgi:hypothetical protein